VTASPIDGAASLRPAGPAADPDAQLRRVAHQIEGLFLREVLKVMRQSVPESTMLQGGLAGDVFGDMLDEELTTRVGETGGLGLANAIALQLGATLAPDRARFPGLAPPGLAPPPGLAAARYRDAASPAWVHPLSQPTLPRGESTRFGAPRSGGTRTHMGVDLAAPEGTPVRSVARGTVERVERDENSGRAGRYLRIVHPGGIVSRYVHMDEVRADLGPGSTVEAGETIGTVGRTGVRHSGTHLHFTLSRREGGPGTSESYIDPESWLEAWSQGISLPPPQIGPQSDDKQMGGL
jgi:murein DD-endopeptidase MepM/ murein hydrolase activator NlpD